MILATFCLQLFSCSCHVDLSSEWSTVVAASLLLLLLLWLLQWWSWCRAGRTERISAGFFAAGVATAGRCMPAGIAALELVAGRKCSKLQGVSCPGCLKNSTVAVFRVAFGSNRRL